MALCTGLRRITHSEYRLDGTGRSRDEADSRSTVSAGLYRRLLFYEQNNAMHAGLQHSGTHRPSLKKEEAGAKPGYFSTCQY